MKRCLITLCLILASACMVNAQTADFEDLALATESYWNGDDASGGFSSGDAFFNNNFNPDWFSWDGFAYSNLTDMTAEGFIAQYNAIPGRGVKGSATYAVGYVSSFAITPPTITLDSEQIISGAYFTNNNYAYYSMKNGDDFSKKFTDDDWFKLTITGIDADGKETGTVNFKLADGTRIVDSWIWVNLEGLGSVKQLTFDLSSTDNGDFGMNTPAYFAMDNFNENSSSDDDSSCFIQSSQPDSLFH